ncbi:MAG: hypothetical protein A3B30_03400 [Candidatus Komeilibacteria bacterium RIFCSPLOWO2_01_FULL_52_15]|uniref:Glycogen synthase n=2 Tax=Candidatus Komeiliibacteriota TaxID=1817908 RepID=A0A1G2BS61_9BACT|nr:MAG: hypothetical protein A2677_01310 [Candidatus Komeilibacteria bacterium RIFCSPHIGHO2_01_FULL_52_14]OGY91067.1 MAG: hypothetical protein A3B30_03400 [Candidatus Komeilibacteria bacterium RIFCSPLOWO2_01_FULL_52_15]
MTVVMAAAECAPFAKIGGLGDVVGSLPQALAQEGVNCIVLLPRYAFLNLHDSHMIKRGSFVVHESKTLERCTLYELRQKSPVRYLFIDHPLLATNTIYHPPTGAKPVETRYARKFSFFSHAVVEAVQQCRLQADIIHCHDWHTALVPTFVDQLAVLKNYPFTKTVLTIHNLGIKGLMRRDALSVSHIKIDSTPSLLEDYYDLDDKHLNSLKLGILSADAITTVSPTYAKEILTHEYGSGLESFLFRRKRDLHGILNGIDTNFFNPAHDPALPKTYSVKDWQKGKCINKRALQHALHLPEKDVPLFGMVSRLVTQKGFDLIIEVLQALLPHAQFQLAVLGTGEKTIEQALRSAAHKHPHSVAAVIGFNLGLAQLIYAGADGFIMPSLFEPCGLGQLIAMRYGTIPIVRATGGLKDTVQNNKTGIVFSRYDTGSLARALLKAISLYGKKKSWYTMVANGMRHDATWRRSADEYLSLYRSLL